LAARTALDAQGCAKTPAFNLHIESFSRFGQSENQKFWRRLFEEGNRENGSTLSWLAQFSHGLAPLSRHSSQGLTASNAQLAANLRPQFWFTELLRPKLPLDEPRGGAGVFLSGESPFLALFDPAAVLVLARER
jgi:hypothetical protein